MAILTERRKADRVKMAATIADIARECGAAVETEDKPFGDMSPQMIMVRVTTKQGLACSFEFDGQSVQPDVFVNGWHMIVDCDTCLSDSFPGSVNRSHFRKSTTVSEGFEALCQHVRRVLEMARDDSCFDPEREARHVAENGSWQERKARFDAWRDELHAKEQAA